LPDGKRDKPALYTVDDDVALQRLTHAIAVINQVKRKWSLPEQTRVAVIYEAGQDGFWISRAMSKQGYEMLVVDPANIPVERHARCAKRDRLDAIRLVMCLRAWLRGELDCVRVVRMPTAQA
jgi:transposase